MDQEAPQKSNPNSMESADSDEPQLAFIHRHPFALVAIYVQAAIGLLAVTALAFFVLPNILQGEDTTRIYSISALLVAVVFLLTMLVLLVATNIERQCHIVVTSKNITQVIQRGLMSRKVSQLSLADVQDVTVDQNGALPTLFNYGTLIIETAGEQVNFSFSLCPKPNYYAELIREAREKINDRNTL